MAGGAALVGIRGRSARTSCARSRYARASSRHPDGCPRYLGAPCYARARSAPGADQRRPAGQRHGDSGARAAGGVTIGCAYGGAGYAAGSGRAGGGDALARAGGSEPGTRAGGGKAPLDGEEIAAAGDVAAGGGAGVVPARTAKGFENANRPYAFAFPRDHAAHFGYQTEWWYYTGHVVAQDGRRFGYELTFFRIGLRPGDPRPKRGKSGGAAIRCMRRTLRSAMKRASSSCITSGWRARR